MALELVDKKIGRWESLKNSDERTNLESVCSEISDFVRPSRGDFTGYKVRGSAQPARRFDDTAIKACQNFGAGLYSMASSPAAPWFQMQLQDDALNAIPQVKEWSQEVTRRLQGLLSRPTAQFYQQIAMVYGDVGAFPTVTMYMPARGDQIHFKAVSLANHVCSENADGVIDTHYRTYTLTAEVAHNFFEGKSEKARKDHDKNPYLRMRFLHVVEPNYAVDPRRKDMMGMPWIGYHISLDDRAIVDVHGFHEDPYATMRWQPEPEGTYGRSIAMDTIANIKGLNAQKRSNLRTGQNVAEPPLLLPNEGLIGRQRIHPGDKVYGGTDPQTGRAMIQPLFTGANLPNSLQMLQEEREQIREAFFYQLMQLAQQPNMTATEVLRRQEENLRLLGPNFGRIESELLEPIITRVFSNALRRGLLPKIPPQLEGRRLQVKFVSPMAAAQQVSNAVGVTRVIETAIGLQAFDPNIGETIDTREALQVMTDANSAPQKIIRTKEEVEALARQRQEQQMVAQGAALAEQGASAALDLAKAQAANAA